MKKYKILTISFILISILGVFFSSCKKDDPNLVSGNVIQVSPFNSAVDVALDVSLLWQAASDLNGDAVTYDVYLGTEATPVTVVSNSQTGTTYSPTLAVNTTYYWKVVAKDGKGGTGESAVWSFTTDIIEWSDTTHGIFTDPRDNNEYNVVKTGDQIWFAENLSYEISGKEITDNSAWSNLSSPGYCWYNNDKATYGDTYGALYNWYAVNTGNLCPPGWHVPTDVEWGTLINYLGGGNVAGGKLKETGTTHWNSPNTDATNETGFTALPGGYREVPGTFFNISYFGFWWSSTENNAGNAWYRYMNYIDAHIPRYNDDKKFGYSVRCLRD